MLLQRVNLQQLDEGAGGRHRAPGPVLHTFAAVVKVGIRFPHFQQLVPAFSLFTILSVMMSVPLFVVLKYNWSQFNNLG